MQSFEQAAELIANSKSIWIGAGAGMGVDSGLPDFRGNDGFWNAYPSYRHLGLSFYDLANPKWFAENPQKAWGFYGHRLNLYRDTDPHAGFSILRKWSSAKNSAETESSNNCIVFTSNVDGQFQKAGFDRRQMVECHGSISHLQCSGPCGPHLWSEDSFRPEIDELTMQASEPLPRCEDCQRLARPNILMLGDWNWVPDRTEQQVARYEQWLANCPKPMVALEFGAGTAIPTVRYEAAKIEANLIRVNPRESECRQGLSFACGALEFLESVDAIIGEL